MSLGSEIKQIKQGSVVPEFQYHLLLLAAAYECHSWQLVDSFHVLGLAMGLQSDREQGEVATQQMIQHREEVFGIEDAVWFVAIAPRCF